MQHQHLKHRCLKLGLRGGDLAALVGISAPKMSNFFKGRVTLDGAKQNEVIQTLDDLERLNQIFPVPVGCHDVKEAALALDRLREGKFDQFVGISSTVDWSETLEETERIRRKFPKIFGNKVSTS
jgi:hypothetical protein